MGGGISNKKQCSTLTKLNPKSIRFLANKLKMSGSENRGSLMWGNQWGYPAELGCKTGICVVVGGKMERRSGKNDHV